MILIRSLVAGQRFSVIPSYLLLVVIALGPVSVVGSALVLADVARPEMPHGDWRFYLAGSLAASPLIESAFMFPVFWLLEKLSVLRGRITLVSAVSWALLHAINYPLQGLLVIWPFWVFSEIVAFWKDRSKNSAYLRVVTVHALYNIGIVSLEILFWFQ